MRTSCGVNLYIRMCTYIYIPLEGYLGLVSPIVIMQIYVRTNVMHICAYIIICVFCEYTVTYTLLIARVY